MSMTPLPTAPSRSQDSATFVTNADAFVAALPGFVTEANALQTDVTTKQTTASTAATNAAASATAAATSATNAATSETNAATSATNAAASATAAAGSASTAAGFTATSTTSLTVGTGSKVFTTQASKSFTVGVFVTASSAATPANFMHGQVTAYSGTSLTVNVLDIGGSGTLNDWNISLAGTQGPQGATGAPGTLSGTTTAAISFNEVDKGTVTSGTVTFTASSANVQRLQVGGALTIATSGWPTSGTFGAILLKLVNAGSATVTLPTVNWIKPDGTTTTTFSTYLAALSGRVALQTSGTDFMLLWSDDAGTTIYGKLL